jgi:hypothetical protein
VTIKKFRGKVMVDIREFYDSNGQDMPTKKGVCLTLEAWEHLARTTKQIEKGIKVI